jgi:hypothetical protein
MDVYHWILNKPWARRGLKVLCTKECCKPRPVTVSGNILSKRMMWRCVKREVGGDRRLALTHLPYFRPRGHLGAPTPRGCKRGECQRVLHHLLLCPHPPAPPQAFACVVQRWVSILQCQYTPCHMPYMPCCTPYCTATILQCWW